MKNYASGTALRIMLPLDNCSGIDFHQFLHIYRQFGYRSWSITYTVLIVRHLTYHTFLYETSVSKARLMAVCIFLIAYSGPFSTWCIMYSVTQLLVIIGIRNSHTRVLLHKCYNFLYVMCASQSGSS